MQDDEQWEAMKRQHWRMVWRLGWLAEAVYAAAIFSFVMSGHQWGNVIQTATMAVVVGLTLWISRRIAVARGEW